MKKAEIVTLSENGAVRVIWQVVGGFSLSLALIGVFVPLLPTTPFILLAAFAFAKSAPRIRIWLTQHRVFGPMIADWEANGAIAPRYKVLACMLMAVVFVGSLIAGAAPAVLIVQSICMTAAAVFILSCANGDR